MAYLKFLGKVVGKQYCGMDEGNHFTVKVDQVVKVSEGKKAQLLKDFPKDWKALSDAEAEKELESVKKGVNEERDKANEANAKAKEEAAKAIEEKSKKKKQNVSEIDEPHRYDKPAKKK